MFNFLSRRLGPEARLGSRRPRLALERLEERAVPAAGISWNSSTGVITVEGTVGHDKAVVSSDAVNVTVTLSQWKYKPQIPLSGYVVIDTKTFAKGEVQEVQ